MAEFIQKHKLFSFYSTLMIIVVLIAIFAPWLAPGDAFSSNLSQALQAPSSQHWFGTDKLGRDVLSRIIVGTAKIHNTYGTTLVTTAKFTSTSNCSRKESLAVNKVSNVSTASKINTPRTGASLLFTRANTLGK